MCYDKVGFHAEKVIVLCVYLCFFFPYLVLSAVTDGNLVFLSFF